MIRRPDHPVSLISHEESVGFWVGEDLRDQHGALFIFPCLYSGFVNLENDHVFGMMEAAFGSATNGNGKEFELSSAEQFAQLDHQHCSLCRNILTSEHGRPMVLRVIVAPCARDPVSDRWGVFINHGAACWGCWRSLCSPDEKLRLWHADVDDSHLEYIEHYARKHLGPPPTDATQLNRIVVDAVASMNRARCTDPLLRQSVVPCPFLWDYRRLLANDDDKEN